MSLTLNDLKNRMANPVKVIHTICGGIVFFHDGVPGRKEGVVNPEKVVLWNGVKPRTDDPIYCPHCSYAVRKNQLTWLIKDD